jgi:hypothetical protein
MRGVIPLLPHTHSWDGAYLFVVSLLHNFTSFPEDLHYFLHYSVVLHVSQSQSHISTDSQSVCLGVEPRLGLMTRYLFFIESYNPVHMGRPL